MNKQILNTGVQSFIRNFSSADILTVLLQKQHFEGIDNKELVEQLESRKKCKSKLPKWYYTEAIYYPPKLAIEQSSSEQAAIYKSQLISGDSLVDITGGLGVDSYYLSKSVRQLVYCEKQKALAEIAKHNFLQLGATNINVQIGDGLSFLESKKGKFDWVYLDPSRRANDQSRIFKLEDTTPSLPESLDILWSKTDHILIKTSPLLDISLGIELLKNVKEIHILAIKNEVKELLWVLESKYIDEPHVLAVNMDKEKVQSFSFKRSEEIESKSVFALPEEYIYEPNTAILKSGAFKILGRRLGLKKLHEHSHLYTSKKLIEFPGRRFKVEITMQYKPRELKKLAIEKANFTTRNFPYSVPDLRKKFRIKDGGESTIFFTTNCLDQLTVLICSPISDAR